MVSLILCKGNPMAHIYNGTYIYKKDATINPSHPYIYTYKMTVDKMVGYYRSLKIEVWENQDYLWTLILKRK